MSRRAAPGLEKRRAREFERELVDRARAWIPGWSLDEDERDFGRALLRVAALFDAEVAERLDKAGEKMRRGFLDWLAIAREAARPARLPVVLKLTDSAAAPVPADARTQLQADADDVSVVLETEEPVTLLPGALSRVIAADAAADTYFEAPPGFTSLDVVPPLPTEWRVKSFAAGGQDKLQLDSELGLAEGLVVAIGAAQYRLQKVDKDIVTVDPKLPAAGVAPESPVRKVTTFTPFEAGSRNLQKHALYIGHADALNLEAAATIEVIGASGIGGESWSYWGKTEAGGDPDWQPLTPGPLKAGAVVLAKPAGSVEPRDIGTVKGMRWIRAMKVTSDQPFVAEEITLRVNAKGDGPCPKDGDAPCPDVKAEAMANATPLAMNSVFFPLGRQPKQFDAFYLGSEEAFSKRGARVCLSIEIANPTFATFSAFAPDVLAGVGQDRALHLFSLDAQGAIKPYAEREALQPAGTPLDAIPAYRAPIWSDGGGGFFVAAAAGNAVWAWHENADRNASKWEPLGTLPDAVLPAGGTPPRIDAMAFLADAAAPAGLLVCSRGGRLFTRRVEQEEAWVGIDAKNGAAIVSIRSIAPVRVAGSGNGTLAAGLIGIAVDGAALPALYRVDSAGACTPHGTATVSDRVIPVAILVDAGTDVLAVAAADAGGNAAVNLRLQWGAGSQVVSLNDEIKGFDLAPAAVPTLAGTSVFATTRNGNVALADSTGLTASSPIPPTFLAVGGAPTLARSCILVPGTRSDAALAVWDPTLRLAPSSSLGSGVVVPNGVALPYGTPLLVGSTTATVAGSSFARGGESFYPFATKIPVAEAGKPVFTFDAPPLSAAAPATMATDGAGDLVLSFVADPAARDGAILVGTKVYTATLSSGTALGATSAILTPTPGAAVALTNVTYRWISPTGGRLVGVVYPVLPPPWTPAMLEASAIRLIGPNPAESGRAKVYGVWGNAQVAVLDAYWASNLVNQFSVDAAIGPWERRLGDNSSNPELSWEFWNGTGWDTLALERDDTFNLKVSGPVKFTVPEGIAQGDWAGKKNYWIRARLVGGDYGQEQITVVTEDVGTGSNKKQKQTIERSMEGVRPPSVVSLHICYGLYDPVMPKHVLAEDSGTVRDQSDANRTPRAVVEAFVPLSWTLGRFEGRSAGTLAKEGSCPPPCECPHATAASGGADAANAADATVPSTGRFVFLGFTRPLSDSSVNVLLTAERERDFDAIGPASAASIVEGRFQPVTTSDGTRALGETGMLTLAFPERTTSTPLFGGSLHWLRIRPRDATGEWSPMLSGAYLNAVWASARETLTRELLGSSEGAPDLVVKVARPPVLRGTLELRVREPLGDEERDRLLAEDKGSVVTEGNPPQHWVLWRKVADPLDEQPTARRYSLDELTGEIRFGNGRHGAIPPVGRDSIVAFTYARTEALPGAATVPANAIRARASLNVVSPVESVEAAYAAQDAAGGAPAEPDDRVLRFGAATLRHRGRAVTLRDYEDIALQGSPEIAQASASLRGTGVRLVVVAAGPNPVPGRSQVRELKDRLLLSAPASLDPSAFGVTGPRLRHAGVNVGLRVRDLALAGPIERHARSGLARYFDTGKGGGTGEGFALGRVPRIEDIARVLVEAPGLDGIASIDVVERLADGTVRPAPARIAGDELFVLDADGVRCEFEIVGALA